MLIETLVRNSKLTDKMHWDMDGYHESATAVPFAVYTTPTKAYKLCISDRAIWANEIPLLETKPSKDNVRLFIALSQASLSQYETFSVIKDWQRNL